MSTADLPLALLAGWFALNMGSSGLAPAFGATIGARVIGPRLAALVFGAFVILGSLLLGSHVAKTLGAGLAPASMFDRSSTLVVLASANAALLIANLLKMPQSTSWVTVAAIVTLGLHGGGLQSHNLTHRMLPAWVLLPLAAFLVSAVAMRQLYPLDGRGLALHSWLRQRKKLMSGLALASSCYVAFAIGANNVANVTGPLAAAGVCSLLVGSLVFAPLFGIGARLMSGPATTIARDLVPLGVVAATLCNIVVASLLLVASHFGLPQSLVHLNAAAVLGVAIVKEGRALMFQGRGTRRMLLLWVATPALAAALTLLGLTVIK